MTHRLAALACLAFAMDAALAQESSRPLWEVGAVAFGTRQQAYPGSSRQVNRGLALPYLIYRGQYLRADGDGIGLRAVKTPRFEFDVSAAGAFGSSADRDPARQGMPGLGTLVEFGPRLKVNLGPGPGGGRWRLDLPVRGVFDLSNHLEYRGTVFQPGVSWSRRAPGAIAYGAGASLLFANERLASTFYEVEPRYATASRPAYDARAGLLATRLSAFASKDLSRDWTLFGFAQLNSVAGAANRDSPLVRQVTGTTVGLGLSWTWLRSDARAAD